MKYVDGFVISVAEKNMEAYRKMAGQGARLWMKHGALEYYECQGDDLGEKSDMGGRTFTELAATKPGETVVFSFIVFKSRKHRDEVNARVMADPEMSPEAFKGKRMPFDMKRMAYGGFKVIVEG